ncbi:MAG: ATP-dependent zinc metalloprotease FtsH [bacterium]
MPEQSQPPQDSQRTPPPHLGARGKKHLWFPIALMVLVAIVLARSFWREEAPSISYTRFKKELSADNVARLEAEGEELRGEFREPIEVPRQATGEKGQEKGETRAIERFTTTMPPFGDEKLTEEVMAKDVELVSKGSGDNSFWLLFVNLLPFLLLIGLLVLMARRARGQAGGLMSIGRSRAKRFEKERAEVSFDDVAGAEEAKQELKEIIEFLRNPERFSRVGGRIPKGVLLVGPPGTGKTLLARAVAGEADVPFFSITGSDFMEMFVGVGASRVRDLFATAKRNTPCIIFLDELDSVGRHRGAGLGGGHDEREQTLNQLLSAMDGFEPTDNLVVIAATNRPDILDPALLRPGRFDRRVVVNLPTVQERTAILKVHTQEVPLADDVDLEGIARSMPGKSGADLRNLVNEAALLAAREGREEVGQEEFHVARDKILMGQPRGGLTLTGAEKRAVAIHEAGHAIVALLSPEADPVEKVSIIPRGRALGATQQLPEERYNLPAEYLHARLRVMLAGRAAEQTALDTMTTGAADDLAEATRLARRMVGQWGMSEKLKHMAFKETESEVFLGEQISRRRQYSEETAREIDLEVKDLIDRRYQEAVSLLKENRQRLEALADALEEKETIEGDELRRIAGTEAHRSGDDRDESEQLEDAETENNESQMQGEAE